MSVHSLNSLLRVLVVDDNEDDLFLFEWAAKKAAPDWELKTILGGELARQCVLGTGPFADQPEWMPDIVLLDLKMPGVDGFEVLDCIRKHPRWHKVIVVIYSSSEDPKDIERAYELRANSFLTKPPDYDTSREMIRTMDAYWRRTKLFVRPNVARN